MGATYLQMQDSVLHFLGDFSGFTREKVKRWINDAYLLLWDEVPGIYKEVTDYLTTTEDYDSTTAITVTVTNGSTTVTSDGATNTAFTAAMVGRYIQLNGTDPWYQIAARVSATQLTLADAYLGDSDTDCAFEVHTFLHSLPSNFHRLVSVTLEDEERWRPLDIQERLHVYDSLAIPLRWTRGNPDRCWVDEKDSSGYYRLGIYPVPDDAVILKLRYEKTCTELSADADLCLIPEAEEALRCYTKACAASFKDKAPLVGYWETKWQQERQKLAHRARKASQVSYRIGSGATRDRRLPSLGPWYPEL